MNANVILNGSEMSGYTESIIRDVQLCTPGQRATIQMVRSAPHTTITPGQTAVIKENGVLVLTGYVDSVRASRPPAGVEVIVSDKFKLARDYFLPDAIETTGETVSYWFGYLCNLVGLPYTIDSSGSSSLALPMVDVQLGTRPLSDSLIAIAAYARWVLRVEPDGTLKAFAPAKKLVADYNFNNGQLEGEHEESDSDTRTTVKIYGFNATTGGVQFSKTRPVAGVPDRNMVFAHPALDTLALAETMADAALDQFASLKEDCKVTIIGNPNVQVGEVGVATVLRYTFLQWITSLHSELSLSGHSMNVGLGRKCFRLPDFGWRRSSGSMAFVATSGSIGRSINFRATATPSWTNITGGSMGIISDMELFRDDQPDKGLVLSSTGVWRCDNLSGSTPLWEQAYEPSQFLTATGKTWSRGGLLRQGWPSSGSGTFYAQVITSANDLYVGRTVDGGYDWDWSFIAAPVSGSAVFGLAPHPDDDNILFTSGSLGSLFRSLNALGSLTFARTWGDVYPSSMVTNIAVQSGIMSSSGSDTSGSSVVYISVGPEALSAASDWALVYEFPVGSYVYAIYNGTVGGIAVTTPVGTTWRGSRSLDSGVTFTTGTTGPPWTTGYTWSTSRMLYTGTSILWSGRDGSPGSPATVWRSTDGGVEYSSGSRPAGDNSVSDMCMHAGQPYAGTLNIALTRGSVARSSDDGLSWTTVFTTASFSGYIVRVMSNGSYIIAIREDAGNPYDTYYRSTSGDLGTWTSPGTTTATPDSHFVCGGYFFRNTAGGLYRSTDGATWTLVHSAIPRPSAVNSTTMMYVEMSSPYNVYVSTDYGVTFTLHSVGTSDELTRLFDIGNNTTIAHSASSPRKLFRHIGGTDLDSALILRSVDSGFNFTDITPPQGGAYFKDSIGLDYYTDGTFHALVGRSSGSMGLVTTFDRGETYYLPSSGSMLSSGSVFNTASALNISPYDFGMMAFLQRDKISYSDDVGYTIQEKIGNFQTAVGALSTTGRRILPVWYVP